MVQTFIHSTYRPTHKARQIPAYQHNINCKFQNQVLRLWELPHKIKAQRCFGNLGRRSVLGALPPQVENNVLWDIEENRN